jgi:hypothetical protein
MADPIPGRGENAQSFNLRNTAALYSLIAAQTIHRADNPLNRRQALPRYDEADVVIYEPHPSYRQRPTSNDLLRLKGIDGKRIYDEYWLGPAIGSLPQYDGGLAAAICEQHLNDKEDVSGTLGGRLTSEVMGIQVEDITKLSLEEIYEAKAGAIRPENPYRLVAATIGRGRGFDINLPTRDSSNHLDALIEVHQSRDGAISGSVIGASVVASGSSVTAQFTTGYENVFGFDGMVKRRAVEYSRMGMPFIDSVWDAGRKIYAPTAYFNGFAIRSDHTMPGNTSAVALSTLPHGDQRILIIPTG